MKEIAIGFIVGLVVLMAFPSLAKTGQSTHQETIFDRLERM